MRHRAALTDEKSHVESFQQTRPNRRTELVVDYVELITDLLDDGGEARQIDVARRLGVAEPTAAKMLKRLITEGLVQQKPYRGISLTPEGNALSESARERHRVVEGFLRAIGVGPGAARIDAEGIEHHVSGETLQVLRRYIERHGERR